MKKWGSFPFFLLILTIFGLFFCFRYTNDTSEINEQRLKFGEKIEKKEKDQQSENNEGKTMLQDHENCYCKSEKTGKKHNFCYIDPQNSTSIGLKFSCDSLKHLENLKLIDNPGPFVNLTDSVKNEEEVVFVSAISYDHTAESFHSLKTFREFNPNRKFILYGLDLDDSIAHEMVKEYNVEFRQFNTSGYPEYVNNWREYRFKPLILAEVMKEYSNIWWMDAHMIVRKPNMTKLLLGEIGESQKSQNLLNSSIIMLIFTGHSNFAVLKPELLNYFPINSMELLKDGDKGYQLGANTIYIARTQFTIHIFKWWVLCALDEKCMNPPGSTVRCSFGSDRFKTFANCFRFDQSVLNLLLINELQDHHKYHSQYGHIF